MLVGISGSDDAGVYQLSESVALVQTVDYFTPIVDDPYDWGRIAAANALSDVYAMGGTPLTALQIVGWPRGDLSLDLLERVFAGGVDVLDLAKCSLVGGHSIDDKEPKYGMAVTGLVHPDDIVTNAGAKVGDALVLTKPIGTGIISTAIKAQKASEELTQHAIAVMAQLNDGASRAMLRVGVHAATDVTGFGLLGHLGEIVRGSGVSARIERSAVPIIDGVVELAEAGVVPGGSARNLESASRMTVFDGVTEIDEIVLADAQTSGGLLIAVDKPLVNALVAALQEEGTATAAVIGEVVQRQLAHGPTGQILVVS